jgi:pimeloyl-ACP methyl ester carboxylesterase
VRTFQNTQRGTPLREWAERFFNMTRWTEMPRGGHFAALEEAALLADYVRATFANAHVPG